MAGEIVGINLPTWGQDAVATVERNGEYPGAPFNDDVGNDTFDDPYLGVNAGGGNNPGIGINTGNIDNLINWDLNPVHLPNRINQRTQAIGGVPLGEGSEDTGQPIRCYQAFDDRSDTASYLTANQAAIPGASFNTNVPGFDIINATPFDVEIGDTLWGVTTPV